MSDGNDFPGKLQSFTENLLTKRLKRRLKNKRKQQNRNVVVDWVLAIIWAACVVLIINQYFFQNYQIPSESMMDTLKVGDMIFVDKLSYGPELLPGVAKLPGITTPKRGQVIVFENPSYISKGPVFTVLQQFIYMLTLTTVDIDRDQNGEQRVHYLIKRAIGSSGDTLRVQKGEVFIRPDGLQDFLQEKTLMQNLGLPFRAKRLVTPSEYTGIEAVGIASAYQEAGLPIPTELGSPDVNTAYKDAFGYDMKRVSVLSDMNPSDSRLSSTARRYNQGWYIPSDRVFPMGDNRDNSRDGRYFGPVDQSRVLGRALFKYWPPSRVGVIP